MNELILVPQDKILAVMPDVQPLLEPAIKLSNGRWDIWSLIACLLNGTHFHLWISIKDGQPDAAMVTQIIDYPKMRTLGLPFLGGTAMRNWLHYQEQIGQWAKAQGCKEMEGYARKGFARFLTDWFFEWQFIRKPL